MTRPLPYQGNASEEPFALVVDLAARLGPVHELGRVESGRVELGRVE